MVRRLRVYLGVLLTRMKSAAHFRANVIAWVLYSPLQIGVLYLLWKIVYAKTSEVGGLRFEEMILYYLVVHFLGRAMLPIQTVNYEVWSEINKGKLDIYLARPVGFLPFVFFRSLGAPSVEICLGVPFFLLFSALLALPIQTDPLVLAAFFASGLLGAVVLFLIQFLIGTLTFWMERIFGIRDLVVSVFMLFSGQILPISALPAPVARLSQYLPFETIFFVPATIYRRSGLDLDVAALMARQAIWIAVLWAVAAAVWTRGVARYASQGG
jgi:ABC-2 type transport system permease protein